MGAKRDDVVAAEALAVAEEGRQDVHEPGRGPSTRPVATSRVELRVWLTDGRSGRACGTADTPRDSLWATARAAAENAARDPLGGPLRKASPAPRGLGVDDQRHPLILPEERAEILSANLRAASRAPSAAVGPFRYVEARETRRLASTLGLTWESRATRYRASGEVSVATDAGTIRLAEEVAARAFAPVACLPFGAALAERAAAISGPRVHVFGPVRALLPARATAALVGWIGDAVVAGAPVIEALAARGVSRKLHLVDDGATPGGLRTRAFDDRGVVPRPLTLIAEGRIAGGYLDVEEARRTGLRPSGHVDDGALRPSNLLLDGGTRSVNAWLGELGEPVLEVDALDLAAPGAIDPVTGRVDVRVDGRVRQGSATVGSVRRLRLTADLGALLDGLVAVTSDLDRVLHVDAPALLVDGFEAHPA
jgi:predicted Zn-dependent protease